MAKAPTAKAPPSCPPSETTSARVAAIAAKLVGMTNQQLYYHVLSHPGDVRTVAASALTQAPNRDAES
jgi:hypothetical protein